MQQFDFEELIKNTSVDMKDDGFKPSSHSPIIDHEVQNDIDELMNSAPVAESDNWVPVNHFIILMMKMTLIWILILTI